MLTFLDQKDNAFPIYIFERIGSCFKYSNIEMPR